MKCGDPAADEGKRMPRGGGGKGHGSKFGRKKEEAIAALRSQRSVEEAARVAGISAQTLYRWMKIPEFEAAYSEARQALFGQAVGRLQQAAGAAVTILLKVMYDSGASRTARLKAADRVLGHTKITGGMEAIGPRLRAVKRTREALKPARPGKGDAVASADEGRSSRKAGHGAKFGRRKEEAIVALLTQRNVEEAARVVPVGTTTLYRWMKDAEFAASYRAARLAAFGQASARLQQASGAAVAVIVKIMVDPGAPAGTRVRAADLVLRYATEASEEDIEACLSELNGARQGAAAILPGGGIRRAA
jgi:transposase-like protein